MASSNPETFLAETWNCLGEYEFFLPESDKEEEVTGAPRKHLDGAKYSP
jgi:hypothetical protein